MAETTNTFLTQAVDIYNDLLIATADNIFYKNTINRIQEAVENLQISEEKKAEMIIMTESNLANSTIAKSMDQSILLIERSGKFTLETSLLQKQIDDISNDISIKQTQSAKDLLVKDSEIAYRAQQKSSMIIQDGINQTAAAKDLLVKESQITSMGKEDTRKDAESAKDLLIKDAQKSNLDKDAIIKTNQANLITRQTTAYADNLKIEKAKVFKDMVFGYSVGGLVAPTDLHTSAISSANALS